jgi:hypothetical protein
MKIAGSPKHTNEDATPAKDHAALVPSVGLVAL